MNKFVQGFSIVEFLAATVIATVSAGAIMFGVSNIRKTTDLLNTKEKAFEQLINYTDFWKAKIAAGEWAGTNTWTPGPQFDLVDKNNRPIRAVLSKKGSAVNGNFPYPLYSLETKITWQDRYGESDIPERELNFKVYQIEFK
tara:strand:+ start:874 stop:1299 length:426 start_codon:yes stop_codon:yes gene_type:complete